MSEPVAWVNGDFVPLSRASVGVNDLAVQRGYGAFDFLRTARGRPVFLDDHLDRLWRSAERMRLRIRLSRDELRGVIGEIIARNGIDDSGLRITVTGGPSSDGYTITEPGLILTQQKLAPPFAGAGVRLVTVEHQRQMPEAKSIDYLMAVWLAPLVKERGADDLLYVHNGLVSECPRSNFFLITRDRVLLTPGAGVLKGITRKHVLELARPRMPVEERDVSIAEVPRAAEAFITSTTKGVLPVLRIDDSPVGDGSPGSITRALGEALAEHVARELERSRIL